MLAACAGTTPSRRPAGPPAGPPLQTTQPAEVGPSALPRNQQLIPRAGAPATAPAPGGLMRAALLVPLTGPSAALGQALVNAAQMALFEVADEHLVLQICDTQGTPDDTARITARAISEGAQIILGPVFAADARAAGTVAAPSGVNIVTFSTDPSVAGNNVFVLGFLVPEQVREIIAYARSQGRERFAVLAPESPYGAAVVEAFNRYVPASGGKIAKVGIYNAAARNIDAVVKQLADYDARKLALAAQKAQLAGKTDEVSVSALKRLEQAETAGDVDFDAILLPDQGADLSRTAALLPFYEIDPGRVQFLGTLLWNQQGSGREQSLLGGLYPAPSPDGNRQFVQRYRELYGASPPTLASHAYDAVALAGALAHSGMARPFAVEALTSPSGFAGVDGIFRFMANGLSERGFAIMQVTREGATVVQPPPTSFGGAQY